MGNDKKKANFWWPDVSTLEQARSAAMGGAAVAGIVAAVTLAFTLYAIYKKPVLNITAWSFVDVVLFVLVAIGIWRLSRTAAVAGLALYIVEQGYQLISIGPKNPVMAIFFILFLVHAIRGTFSYHRLENAYAAAQQGAQADGPASGGPAA